MRGACRVRPSCASAGSAGSAGAAEIVSGFATASSAARRPSRGAKAANGEEREGKEQRTGTTRGRAPANDVWRRFWTGWSFPKFCNSKSSQTAVGRHDDFHEEGPLADARLRHCGSNKIATIDFWQELCEIFHKVLWRHEITRPSRADGWFEIRGATACNAIFSTGDQANSAERNWGSAARAASGGVTPPFRMSKYFSVRVVFAIENFSSAVALP